MSIDKQQTAMIGTKSGGLMQVTIPAGAIKKDNETLAAFYRRVGTYTVVREA